MLTGENNHVVEVVFAGNQCGDKLVSLALVFCVDHPDEHPTLDILLVDYC